MEELLRSSAASVVVVVGKAEVAGGTAAEAPDEEKVEEVQEEVGVEARLPTTPTLPDSASSIGRRSSLCCSRRRSRHPAHSKNRA